MIQKIPYCLSPWSHGWSFMACLLGKIVIQHVQMGTLSQTTLE
jgi:hypothetical protein